MKRNHEIVKIQADLVRETQLAYLLNDGSKKSWVPKTQVEDNEDGTFSIPEWIAIDKGFL